MSKRKFREIKTEIDTLVGYKAFGIINDMAVKANRSLPLMETDKILFYLEQIFPHRNDIPAWPYYLENAAVELGKRKLDVSTLLANYIEKI